MSNVKRWYSPRCALRTAQAMPQASAPPRGQATEVASHLLSIIKVDDVLIEEPPVEDIIRQVFAESRAARELDSSLMQ